MELVELCPVMTNHNKVTEIILFDCNQHFSAQQELKLCMWLLIVTLSYLVII